METKYGTAKINTSGYYYIISRREGNKNKLLHRLIWEDFWKTEVPQGYHIHHKNGNKLDNCILNLQLMREKDHLSLHHKNKNLSEETKIKMSESQNNSGYYRVVKHKKKDCKQGFIWRYQYYVDSKRKVIVSVDIKKLEQKVKSKGLLWKKIEEE